MVAAYDSLEHARQQLQGTVVMFDEAPVWINEIFQADNGLAVNLSILPRIHDPIIVSLTDHRLDARNLGSRLGYVNMNTEAVYLSRIPSRQTKQGLARTNVFVAVADSGGDRGPRPYRLNFDRVMNTPGFVDAMANAYPDLDRCKELFDGNPDISSLAISKDFAVVREELGYYILLYRNDRVGWGDLQGFKVPDEYSYLRNRMGALGIRHA